MRNSNPYANVDWEKCYRIHTTNHIHAHVSEMSSFLETMKRGYDLLTLSNYYPSCPYYPLASVKKNSFAVSQAHGVMYKQKFLEGPLNWNEIIDEWKDDLGENEQANFPFVEGEAAFEISKADVIKHVDVYLVVGAKLVGLRKLTMIIGDVHLAVVGDVVHLDLGVNGA